MVAELTPPVSRRSLVGRVLLALGILLAANVAVSIAFRHVTVNRGYETVALKWKMIDAQTEPVDWLLVGDSSCNQGLDPRVFESDAGLTALNLCTTGDMLVVGDAWSVEEYLRTVGPPRSGILVTHSYDVWARDETRIRALGWVIPAGDSWRRERSLIDATISERVLAVVGSWLPFIAQPSSTLRLLTDPRSVIDAPSPNLTAEGFRQAGPADPDAVRRDADNHLRSVVDTDAVPSSINSAAVDELVRLADEAGVPLVFSPSPLLDVLWDDDTFRSRFHDATSLVAEVAAREEGVVLLRRDPWLYQASQMQNADHLSQETAGIHTSVVLRELDRAGLLQP